MLLNFGAQNFFCFREGVNVSLELDGKCPAEISKNKKVSNVLCIKGANGSGKTNILKILSFIREFCCDSWGRKPEDDILITSFFNNDHPINIYCEFLIKDITYLYEVKLTDKKIISESLSRKKNRYTEMFKRSGDRIVSSIKEFSNLEKIKLRTNASIFSTANQYEIVNMKKFYNFFNSIYTNVGWSGRKTFSPNISILSEIYKNSAPIFNELIKFLKNSDLGIDKVEIRTRKDEKDETIYFPIFYHTAQNVKHNYLTYWEQSSGTKTIFETFPYYFNAIANGGILALDELDKDLHPHILPKFIDYFLDDDKNPNNAQLVFTAHNTEIIDKISKYRTYLVNKENSESFGYRLDEISGDLLRNDRSIATIYDKGKLGGVPLL